MNGNRKENGTPKKGLSPKQVFKPGNMLYPLPAVLVSVGDVSGESNLFTAAWTGTVCTNPPMLYISVRPERYSYHLLRESGEFVVNLTTESLAREVDYCGVRSGRDTDKWKDTGLTRGTAEKVRAPIVQECPVNLECRVVKVEELGSHHMFLASVESVDVDETLLDDKGTLRLERAGLLAYSHGRYYGLGAARGSFGFSVRKRGAADGAKQCAGRPPGKRAARPQAVYKKQAAKGSGK